MLHRAPLLFLNEENPNDWYPPTEGTNPENIRRLADRIVRVDGDLALLKHFSCHSEREGAQSVDMLVSGLVPRGTVTLLGGATGVGKSTVAAELAVQVRPRRSTSMWRVTPSTPSWPRWG